MFSIRCTPTGFASNLTSFRDSGSSDRGENVTFATVSPQMAYNDSLTTTYGGSFFDDMNGGFSAAEKVEEVLNSKVIGVVCVLGLLGNTLNLLVLTHRSLKAAMERLEKSAHHGMLALALSDLCLCLVLLPHAFVNRSVADSKYLTFDLMYTVYGVGIINTFIMTSTWLTVYMALSRYLAIVYPLLARRMLGSKFTNLSLTVIFICSIACNMPKFFVSSIAPLQCQV